MKTSYIVSLLFFFYIQAIEASDSLLASVYIKRRTERIKHDANNYTLRFFFSLDWDYKSSKSFGNEAYLISAFIGDDEVFIVSPSEHGEKLSRSSHTMISASQFRERFISPLSSQEKLKILDETFQDWHLMQTSMKKFLMGNKSSPIYTDILDDYFSLFGTDLFKYFQELSSPQTGKIVKPEVYSLWQKHLHIGSKKSRYDSFMSVDFQHAVAKGKIDLYKLARFIYQAPEWKEMLTHSRGTEELLDSIFQYNQTAKKAVNVVISTLRYNEHEVNHDKVRARILFKDLSSNLSVTNAKSLSTIFSGGHLAQEEYLPSFLRFYEKASTSSPIGDEFLQQLLNDFSNISAKSQVLILNSDLFIQSVYSEALVIIRLSPLPLEPGPLSPNQARLYQLISDPSFLETHKAGQKEWGKDFLYNELLGSRHDITLRRKASFYHHAYVGNQQAASSLFVAVIKNGRPSDMEFIYEVLSRNEFAKSLLIPELNEITTTYSRRAMAEYKSTLSKRLSWSERRQKKKEFSLQLKDLQREVETAKRNLNALPPGQLTLAAPMSSGQLSLADKKEGALTLVRPDQEGVSVKRPQSSRFKRFCIKLGLSKLLGIK